MIKRATILGCVVLAAACAPKPGVWTSLDGRTLTEETIDSTIDRLIAANDVKGFALALIADGEVAYLKAYGVRTLDPDLPLEANTVMYGASLTKATFAWFVMQLADEGLIDLDKSVSEYLAKPLPEYDEYAHLAGDARWRKLTMRILLSHTPGFANFRFFDRQGDYDPDGKLAIYFDPGTHYAYSGEGFLLAQRVLEWGLGIDVGAEMQRRIFDRFGMTKTSMVWRDDFQENFAHNFSVDGENLRHNTRSNVRAPGSMDTTPADWSKFLAAVARGEGLSSASKAEMIRTQIRIRSEAQFPTLSGRETGAYDAIGLGYGLGWGVFNSPFGRAFFKEGHDDGTANYALCIDPDETCILMMSNSVRAEGIFKEVADTLLGDTGLPWKWEGYVPYNMDNTAD